VRQIAGDNTEPDPTMQAAEATIATAAQAMSTFEHADAAFAADAPALPAPEPALTFIGAPGRRLGADARQDHASHPAVHRCLFVPGRAETAVAGGQIRPTAEN